jgi:N-acetylated-alpha-linked acidic dipeptidase
VALAGILASPGQAGGEKPRSAAPPAGPAALVEAVERVPEAARLRAWHDLIASHPHVAGSEGDAAVIRSIAGAFGEMGLEVEQHDFWALLARPVSQQVEILSPERVELRLTEADLAEDPYDAQDGFFPGWNAYSGSGDVSGRVVYANQGTKEDFAKLREWGVSCTGAVVVARYGGNYRGFKAKYAQEAGAAALLIYSDPADVGWVKGLPWPEAGWFGATTIQRGSLLTLPWIGDPLTPGTPATRSARRLREEDVALPRIPVQPMGWGAAQEILSRMRGRVVPAAEWQGGLPFTYRLEGGDDLRVRVDVVQERKLMQTANVVGTLRGARWPDQLVILGAHHDAWGCGAADPTSGTILVLEAARAFAKAANDGHRPARSVAFAAWGAEEFGIIGSSEWVESRGKQLERSAVAYFNADMASMGPDVGASAVPSLQAVILEATRGVPQLDTKDDVHAAWIHRAPDPHDATLPEIGPMGGGSDHVAFLCHAGVPSASITGEGSQGSSYHSNHDDLAWYRKVVGDDYKPALMLCRIDAKVLALIADAPLVPLDPQRGAELAQGPLDELAKRAVELKTTLDIAPLVAAARHVSARGDRVVARLRHAAEVGTLAGRDLDEANALLLAMDRDWLDERGLPDRPWFRSLLAAPDETSGYAAWQLPGLRHAVESKDSAAVDDMVARYEAVFDRMLAHVAKLEALATRAGR